MDLDIVVGDWPYDDDEDANNVRKLIGVDGRQKVQLRIRTGLIQWNADGRPDGRAPHGYPSVLDYCRSLLAQGEALNLAADRSSNALNSDLVEELAEEMFDYYRRGRALFLLGDYRRAVSDSVHNLSVLRLIRRHGADVADAFSYERYRVCLLLDRARAQMLLNLQAGDVRGAVDALNRGIKEIEDFHSEYELEQELADSPERQILVDLRRSLREKYSVPLTDDELMLSLKVEQEIAIRRENYEMAARLRDKINSLRQRARTPGLTQDQRGAPR